MPSISLRHQHQWPFMSGGKWRSVSVYAPLVKKIEEMIEEGHILYSNANQFINAAVERAYQEERSKVPDSN